MRIPEQILLHLQPVPVPVKMTPVGPVNQHLHGGQAKSVSPAPLAAPAKRTRGKDKHPRGPRKTSKRISKDGAQRREAAAASSRAPRVRTSPNKRHARRPSQTDDDVPQVMKRPQRKRKAPVSADASPVAAAPTATHAMTSRKRTKPPVTSESVAEQDDASGAGVDAAAAAADAAAKPKRASRPAKKAVKTGPEHAVAQAVPAHIAGQQQPQSEQQPVVVPYHQSSAVAVAPHAALIGNSVAAAVPAHLTEQSQAANSQAQSQSGHPSALLLLAQQQMQQRLNQQSQCLPAASQQPDSSAWSEAPGASSSVVSGPSSGQELRPLGTATAQQALLAQLISQQAAQGLNAYALDGSMHPFFSQGLAGAFLRQAMPAQQMMSQEHAQSLEQQQLNPQLQQSTDAVLPQAGVLNPSQAITPGSVEPVASHGQDPALEQGHTVSQAPEAMQQHPVMQQGTTALQAALQSQQQQAALQDAAAVPDAMPQVGALSWPCRRLSVCCVDITSNVSLIDWASDTLHQGCTDLPCLVSCLDHRESDTTCSYCKQMYVSTKLDVSYVQAIMFGCRLKHLVQSLMASMIRSKQKPLMFHRPTFLIRIAFRRMLC